MLAFYASFLFYAGRSLGHTPWLATMGHTPWLQRNRINSLLCGKRVIGKLARWRRCTEAVMRHNYYYTITHVIIYRQSEMGRACAQYQVTLDDLD